MLISIPLFPSTNAAQRYDYPNGLSDERRRRRKQGTGQSSLTRQAKHKQKEGSSFPERMSCSLVDSKVIMYLWSISVWSIHGEAMGHGK